MTLPPSKLALLICALLATEGMAQNALDNNLQTGSGGVNPGGRRDRPGAYQDAIITGNVGGLHRFRGEIDYRAAGEFTDTTSGDRTFSFRLRSLPPTPQGVQRYQRPDVLPRVGPGTQFLLRPGAGVTAGEVTGQYQRFGGGPARRDDATAMSARQPRTGAALDNAKVETAISLDVAAAREQSIAIRADESGSLYEIVASPLRGVRQRDLGRALQLRHDETVPRETEADEKPAPVTDQQAWRISDALPPLSSLIGQRLVPAEQRDGGAVAVTPYRYSSGELARAVLRPLDDFAVTPGADIYYDLLRQVAGREQPYRAIAADRLGQAPPEPTRPQTVDEKAAQAQAQTQEEPAERSPEAEKAAFELFMQRLKYDVTLKTLVSGTQSPFDNAMAAAESLMAEGRYFEAEAAYGQALGRPGATPLAIVGLAHAQIGAGLHATAGQSLRRLFDHHPELIAARYEPPVLPSEQRTREVAEDVEGLLRTAKTGDLLLLSAYLAYQRQDLDTLNRALADMAELDTDDALVPLLRRIWTEPRPAQPGAPQDQAPGK